MPNLKTFFKHLTYRLQYVCIRLLYAFLLALGYEKASNFGSFITKKLIKFSKRSNLILNNLLKSNLKISTEKALTLQKEISGNIGRLFAEFPFVASWEEQDFKKYIKIIGAENLPKDGAPTIILSGHFGNWEILVNQLSFLHKPYVVYRKQNNFLLEKFFQSLRASSKRVTFVEKKNFARTLPEIIKNKGTLGLLCDLKEEGFTGKFLGRTAKIGTSPAKLVEKYGFKIVPVRIDRFNKHYFNIHIYPEIKFDKDDLEKKNYKNMTMQIYKIYESWIAQHPSNWYWVHRRWS